MELGAIVLQAVSELARKDAAAPPSALIALRKTRVHSCAHELTKLIKKRLDLARHVVRRRIVGGGGALEIDLLLALLRRSSGAMIAVPH